MKYIRLLITSLACFSLNGCSVLGCLYIYNSLESDIKLEFVAEPGDISKAVLVETNKVNYIRSSFGAKKNLRIKSNDEIFCYNVPSIVDNDWIQIKLTSLGPSVYTILTDDNLIYIYNRKSHGDDEYFNNAIPKQPKGFPIKPTRCEF